MLKAQMALVKIKPNVRFGSKADMCSAKRHVRFTPNSDRKSGFPPGARPLYERALAIRENVLGPEHPQTAASLSNLAGLLRDDGRADEAELLFRRVLAIYEKTLGLGHSQTQRCASHYARLLLATGRASDALDLAQAALATHKASFGPNHTWTKDSARVTADALAALGRAAEAAALRASYSIEAEPTPAGVMPPRRREGQ